MNALELAFANDKFLALYYRFGFVRQFVATKPYQLFDALVALNVSEFEFFKTVTNA